MLHRTVKVRFTPFEGHSLQDGLALGKEAALGLVSVRMSWVAFHLDYVVFPPVILACLAVSARNLDALHVSLLYALGLFVWTFAEYVLHRYALHKWPYFAAFHEAHHDEPRAMVAAPTLFSVAFFFVLFYAPAWFFLGQANALAWFAGFLTGYVAFAAVHHMVHHAERHGKLLRYFKRLHAIHHHGDTGKNFGVTTHLWDVVFGTYSPSLKRRTGKA